MFDFAVIDEYQLEITTYCNASCPQCPRNVNGGVINPYLTLEHLPRLVIDAAFTEDLCSRLRQVFFCGSYGDPIMHPDFLDILRDFRRKCPTLWLYVHTNGGAHDTEYWTAMAEIIGGYGQVDFNIDGLDDTNHLYRRNTDFGKIINNATAYINAGGRAVWNYIIFEHNQHQVEQARELSNSLGFKEFKHRATGRFLNHRTMEEFSEWPVQNRQGQTEYVIKPTVLKQYKNKSIAILPELKKQHPDITEYFANTEICCDSLKGNKVAINAAGLVLPCNMLNHNLSDARFRDQSVLPCSNDLSTTDGKNQVQEFVDRHGADNLNIHHRSLEQVFANSFWVDLVNSWAYNTFPERLFECAMTCGKQFQKVWDQTKMTNTFLITGGNRGLGLHLTEVFGGTSISRAQGYDITKHAKEIAEISLDFDVFVNNAQSAWHQTELLVHMANRWRDQPGRIIINIGSTVASYSKSHGDDKEFSQYRNQKRTLQDAFQQLVQQCQCRLILINPGPTDTDLMQGIAVDKMSADLVAKYVQLAMAYPEIKRLDIWQ